MSRENFGNHTQLLFSNAVQKQLSVLLPLCAVFHEGLNHLSSKQVLFIPLYRSLRIITFCIDWWCSCANKRVQQSPVTRIRIVLQQVHLTTKIPVIFGFH